MENKTYSNELTLSGFEEFKTCLNAWSNTKSNYMKLLITEVCLL